MKIVKIGSVELTEQEAQKIYSENKYIVTYSRIFRVNYSNAQKTFYGTEIYYSKGMTKRGRFFVMDAKTINNMLRFNLLNEEE